MICSTQGGFEKSRTSHRHRDPLYVSRSASRRQKPERKRIESSCRKMEGQRVENVSFCRGKVIDVIRK